MFAGLSNVETLQLTGSLKKLTQGVFEGLADLKHLVILRLNLESVEPGAFAGLADLRKLRIVDDALPVLEPGVFAELASLRYLRVETYSLASIGAGVFGGLGELVDLRIISGSTDAGGALTVLAPNAFARLSKLEILWLSHTGLAGLPEGLFDGLTELLELDVSFSPSLTLRPGVFKQLSKLVDLALTFDGLTAIEAGVFEGLHNVRNLKLWYNRLTRLESGTFRGLPHLQKLHLPVNRLSEIAPGAFGGLHRLYLVDLQRNNLRRLAIGTFAGTSLERLFLERNALTELAPAVLEEAEYLRILDLRANNLKELAPATFKGLEFLHSLDLRDNPGSPFNLAPRIVRLPDAAAPFGGPVDVVPEVAEGAPFDMSVALSVSGGTLSSDVMRIETGQVLGEPIRVTRSGNGPLTVGLSSPPVIPLHPGCHLDYVKLHCYKGLNLATAPPLVLYGFLDQELAQGEAARLLLGDAFPGFPDGSSYAVESSDVAVVSVRVTNGVLTVAAVGAGAATVTVTATGIDGRGVTRRFAVQVRAPDLNRSSWSGWRLELLRRLAEEREIAPRTDERGRIE